MASEIMVVSGLPRSGTSLMMQMLAHGGVEVVTDNVRQADADNPRGYYEYELAKKIKTDSSWLAAMRGKAFKMVSQLLYDLPATETYRILFMERDLDETLLSQEKMLQRLRQAVVPREEMKRAYTLHLERLHAWLAQQPNIAILRVNYSDLVARPGVQSERVSEFLGGGLDVDRMSRTVEPSLYRNKSTWPPQGSTMASG
jgi:hypothetical protein